MNDNVENNDTVNDAVADLPTEPKSPFAKYDIGAAMSMLQGLADKGYVIVDDEPVVGDAPDEELKISLPEEVDEVIAIAKKVRDGLDVGFETSAFDVVFRTAVDIYARSRGM